MLYQIYKKQQIVQFPWPSQFIHHGGMRRITRNRRVILSKFKKLLEFPIIKYIYQQKMIGTSTRPRRASNNANHRQIGQYSYSIKDVIGEGFSSKVYKGLDRTTQSQVAIKLINNDILTEPINKTLLDFELEILQLMKGCPNVLEMHEIIKQSQDTYIITEVCTTDLNKMLIPLLPLQEVEKYIDQLINGFNQFFTKEVIHRDLKPANLLIDTQGNLKIGDFGFAIKSSEARKQTKFNIGSPLYMAPQALKKNEYTHKSDIWSIGIIIYEMLTGDNPWKAENQQELYRKLDNTRIEQILAGESFPQHIKDLLTKTLQFERKHRITPQQLIKIKMPRTWIHRQQQQKLKKEQQKFENSHYIPRTNKNTKTQKFVKVSKDCPATLHKTQKSIKDEPSNVTIRPVIRRPQYSVKNNQVQNSTLLSVPTYEKQRNSAAKTNGSTTIAPSENQGPKLTKQQAKAITKKLINYVHICRLLYKVLTRINQCIENSKNQFVVESLGNAKDNLFRLYCPIIVKHMHQVKNFASNNFLELTPIELDDYVMCSQFKKLRKICGEYIQRYSKSNELKMLWIQIEQPDYSASIKETVKLISELWPELCQKNHNEIILLEFLVFTRQALQVLHDDKIDELCAKDDIEKYVDTIPNPPTMNRFKQAIIKAKKIGGEKKQWSVEVASNGLH